MGQARVVFKQCFKVRCNWNTGVSIDTSEHYSYHYGYIPQNKSVKFYGNEAFIKLGELLHYPIQKWMTNENRQYIDIETDNFNECRIFNTELLSIEVISTYTELKNARIRWLEENLTFNDYTQMVFDRYKQLKSEDTI